MYYSSENSDSEQGDTEARHAQRLDFADLMLDTDSLNAQLQNSIREQRNRLKLVDQRENQFVSASHSNCDKEANLAADQDEDFAVDEVTERLFLNNNLIVALPYEITKFTNLKTLDLSNNNISQMNDFLLQLQNLQSLYLRNNHITDDGLPKDLSVLKKLKEINLSGNQLNRIPEQLLQMTTLRYLYLGNNHITEVQPEIKNIQSLQVLNLGGNRLETVPDELGDLPKLAALVLCDNRLCKLPRAISRLKSLRSLLLHKNNLCCLPVEIVRLGGLTEISIRDNPLVTRFVNHCAREIMYNTPSLLELAARKIKFESIPYGPQDLPQTLHEYMSSAHHCVNPKCKGVYFTSRVEHIKFVDFCGVYRVPLMHYLCSSRCSSQTPVYYRSDDMQDSEGEEEEPKARLRKVLLG
ncbi:uncharacterized protein LOC143038943 [Oratosquilla oratoria]|uniref:uncharacterized protein LOC143038943 n=1 Tax=Oratosquilla oratoria TaxID=337810 RepID=UPI003F764FE2